MKSKLHFVSNCFRASCIKAFLLLTGMRSAFLFAVGIVLLTAGLKELSNADYPEQLGTDTSGVQEQQGDTSSLMSLPGIPYQPLFTIPYQDNDAPPDDTLFRFATGNLFMLIEGAFGALVMVAAGIGAIIAAVMGAYKTALSLLVVAVGAFILRSLVSLFFGTNYPAYTSGVGGFAVNETITSPIPF